MRVTISLPDSLARPLEVELVKREGELEKACAAANADCRLAEEIDEWQAFDDVGGRHPRRR